MSRSPMRRRLLTGVAAISLAAGSALVGAVHADAATSTLFTITKVAPNKIAALTANQVVTITGTGFDEDSIASVDLGGCTGATYIVQSSTTLLAKTPNNTCGTATSSSTVGETITITDANSDTYTFSGNATTGLFYVTAPSIASTDPVITDLSSNLTSSNKVKQFRAGGGQTIRVTAGSGYTFPTTANAVTATIGGTALTGITVASGGASFTATTPAHATGNVGLQITANGVTKGFTSTATGASYYAPPTVTSIAPTSTKAVPAGGSGGNVVITGTGFSATSSSNTVKVCGQTATVSAATTTSITFATPDPSFTSGFEGVCPVTVTVASVTSPITAASFLAYLTQ